MHASTRKLLTIGCGAAALTVMAGGVACIVGIAYIASDPPGVRIGVDAPSVVTLDENFELTVIVQNEREDRSFDLTSIDVADVYLDGFVVVRTEPPARSSMHIPIDNSQSFEFDRTLPSRGSEQIIFHLKPIKAGIYRGDIDVVEGMRFTTTLAQTVVRAD